MMWVSREIYMNQPCLGRLACWATQGYCRMSLILARLLSVKLSMALTSLMRLGGQFWLAVERAAWKLGSLKRRWDSLQHNIELRPVMSQRQVMPRAKISSDSSMGGLSRMKPCLILSIWEGLMKPQSPSSIFSQAVMPPLMKQLSMSFHSSPTTHILRLLTSPCRLLRPYRYCRAEQTAQMIRQMSRAGRGKRFLRSQSSRSKGSQLMTTWFMVQQKTPVTYSSWGLAVLTMQRWGWRRVLRSRIMSWRCSSSQGLILMRKEQGCWGWLFWMLARSPPIQTYYRHSNTHTHFSKITPPNMMEHMSDTESQRTDEHRIKEHTNNRLLAALLTLSDWNKIDLQLQESGNSKVFIRLLLMGFYPINLLLLYLSLTGQFSLSEQLDSLGSGVIYYRTLQILLGLDEALLLGVIIYASLTPPTPLTANSYTARILSSYSVLVELQIHIGAILLIISPIENLAFFVVGLLLQLVGAFFLENYLFWKDKTYYASHSGNLLLSLFISLTYVLNSILPSQEGLVISVMIEAALLLLWFGLYGNWLFVHAINSNTLLGVLSLHFAVVVTLVQAHFCEHSLGINDIAPLFLSWGVCLISLNMLTRRWELWPVEMDWAGLKRYYLRVQGLLNTKKENLQNDSYFEGIYYEHSLICSSVNCAIGQKVLYDPLTFEELNSADTKFNKETRFKYLIKCLFEGLLASNPKDTALMLAYLDFNLVEFGNPKAIDFYLQALGTVELRLLDRIQLHKLKTCFRGRVDLVTGSLCDGQMKVETVVAAEECYRQLSKQIQEYIHCYMGVWASFEGEEVDLWELKVQLEANSRLRDCIDEKWKLVQDHFNYHRQWFYIFVNYSLLLKNEKPTAKITEFFGVNASEKGIFENDYYYHPPSNTLRTLIEQGLLFHPHSFSLHAKHSQQQLLITQASQFAKSVVGYSPSELINMPLSIILPPDIAEKHAEQFEEWAEKGYSTNEHAFNNRFAEAYTKDRSLVPVIKYYKISTNLNAEVEYVCLLKENQKQKVEVQDEGFNEVEEEGGLCDQFSEGSVTAFAKLAGTSSNGRGRQPEAMREKQHNKLFDTSANIFIKEPELNAVQQLSEASQIRVLTRIFSLLLLGTIFGLFLLTSAEANSAVDYSDQYINFMRAYSIPIDLGINYFSNIMGIGDPTRVAADVGSLSAELSALNKNTNTIKTVFDGNINQNAVYLPHMNDTVNLGRSYNQVGLYYLISENTNSLSVLPVDSQGKPFKLFNSYIKPGYDTLLNKAKERFHSSFQDFFADLDVRETFIAVAQVVILIILLTLVLLRIRAFFNSLKEIMRVIIGISAENVSLIQQHWGRLFVLFDNIRARTQQESVQQSNQARSSLMKTQFKHADGPDQNQISLNTRAKNLLYERQQRRFYCKLVTIAVVSMVLVVVEMIICEVIIISQVDELVEYENDGFAFLAYFPVANTVTYGTLEKAYSLTNTSVPFQPSRFADVLQSMMEQGQLEYIDTPKDPSSAYYNKQRNYLFSDPCAYNPAVLQGMGYSLADCHSVLNGSFSRGITAYLRDAWMISQDSINNNQTQLTPAQLAELTLGTAILSKYVQDTIETWGAEFKSRVSDFVSFVSQTSLINIILLIVLHLVLFEVVLFRELDKEYAFYRSTFDNMFPQYLLLEEKVTKQKLIQIGIIKG